MEQKTVSEPLPAAFDVIAYTGQVSMVGYEQLCKELREKKTHDVGLLILGTPGGDAHAGFRIARALGHAYREFYALVPRYCKSAGTLIVIGAKRLYLDDMSELGPLDIQIKKGDELTGRNSGLEFLKAVDYLQAQSMSAFKSHLIDLTQGAGLSTRVASDIAVRLTAGLLEPIAAQIDPLKLAEMQRASEIAFEYGTRLAEKSGNIREGGLDKLVASYPSHGFVIDRKEAATIFIDVQRPTGHLEQISLAFRDAMKPNLNNAVPNVVLFSIDPTVESQNGQTVSNAAGASGGTESSQSKNDGDFTGTGTSTAGDAGAGAGAEQSATNAPAPAANDPAGPPDPPAGIASANANA